MSANSPRGELLSSNTGLQGARALVVFVDQIDLPWLRWLRRGFRHCFVVVETPQGWIACDPLSNRTELGCIVGPSAGELAKFYRSAGLCVVETTVKKAPPRLAPVRLFTCVEAVKRVLGVHAPWALTPWQLYRLLCIARPGCKHRLTGQQT